MQEVNVTDLTLIDIYDAARKPLSGNFTAETLSRLLVEEWVPFVECQQCGRSDYCRFAQPIPDSPGQFVEIRCGVTATALTNFITRTFDVFSNLSPEHRQDYLDAAFHYARYVHDSEQILGMHLSKRHLDYWSQFSPVVFGQVAKLRQSLEGLAGALSSIQQFRTGKGILLVEGASEVSFFDQLRQTHISWFIDLIVKQYKGRGNRRTNRLEMLLQHYVATGYKIYISGDADGGSTNIFDALILKKLVSPDATFAFKYDFETSIPNGLLYKALQDMGELAGVDFGKFCCERSAYSGSVVQLLAAVYGINIDERKVELADRIACQLSNRDYAWWHDSDFMATELGRFLRFVQGIG